MTLDLDRLHKKNGARRSGNTFRLLAEVFGNMEFIEDCQLHVIFIPYGRNHTYMVHAVHEYADATQTPIHFTGSGGTVFQFENGGIIKIMSDDVFSRRKIHGMKYREFFDL